MRNWRGFFSQADVKAMPDNVREAKSGTSGEIMIHIERKGGIR